jgi:glycolate oxidase iron-sulfur subunit
MTMNTNKTLNDFEKEIRECVKCGICQAHCPTYIANRREGAVARGKIALAAALLTGETDLESRLQQDISMCLMCGSCVAKCPNRVPTNEIVGAIRREITDNQGLSLIGKGVSALLGSTTLMKAMSKGGAIISSLFLKKVPDTSGLRLRFSTSGMESRTLPKPAFHTLFDRFPEWIEGDPDKPAVGLFAGCAITYLYPEIGATMIRLLQRMGFSVYLPREQKCCGIPALSAGNGSLVIELADANVRAFSGRKVEAVITACASCNGGIGEYYQTMKADYGAFTGKVIDFSIFLKKQGLIEKLAAMAKWPERTKVTYHDPCHLKTQGITKEPRELLQALPNVDFVEMENAAACCGLGGTFSVSNYECSKTIGARKIPGLRESGATLIATACPGCIIQLQDIINHASLRIKAVHLLDLVDEALKAESKVSG